MSLIPSESYSFPDHFTSTVTPSRKPKNKEPESAPLEAPRRKPSIVALPDPKPQPAPVPAVIRENVAPEPSQVPDPEVVRENPAPELSQPPDPEVICENPEPMRSKAPAPSASPLPNPALRRASAPPPRIPEPPKKISLPPTLKPKVRWNNRAPAMDPTPIANNGAENVSRGMPAAPAQNVIPMKPIQRPRPPRMMPPPPENLVPKNPLAAPPPRPDPVAKAPRPVQAPPVPVTRAPRPAPAQKVPKNPRPVVASNPQADFFEVFTQNGETAVSRRRRKAKMRRFVVCESIAVGVLLPLAILGLAHRPENAALLWIMNISTIASAVAAAVIPIFFFALTPTLPEIER